jgi:hypothetical protein
LKAAYGMMQRHMAMKKRVSQLRNELRAAIHWCSLSSIP